MYLQTAHRCSSPGIDRTRPSSKGVRSRRRPPWTGRRFSAPPCPSRSRACGGTSPLVQCSGESSSLVAFSGKAERFIRLLAQQLGLRCWLQQRRPAGVPCLMAALLQPPPTPRLPPSNEPRSPTTRTEQHWQLQLLLELTRPSRRRKTIAPAPGRRYQVELPGACHLAAVPSQSCAPVVKQTPPH